MDNLRIPLPELNLLLGPLKHRYGAICYMMILHYVEMTIKQLSRIWNDSTINKIYLNLNHTLFTTNEKVWNHNFDAMLHIREIHFMFICIVNTKHFLKSLKEIVDQSSLTKKKSLLEALTQILTELKNLKYKETRDYFEHLDEKIELCEKKGKNKQVIPSQRTENLIFPNFDPNSGILRIQIIGESAQEIDISVNTVKQYTSSITSLLNDLREACIEALSSQERKSLEKLRKERCLPPFRRS